MAQRRRTYRVDRSLSDVSVRLVVGARRVRVRLEDVSSHGCALRVSPALARQLPKGSTHQVLIGGPWDKDPIAFEGQVRHQRKGSGGVLVGLQFAPCPGLASETRPVVWRVFNRRKHFRAAAPMGLAVQVVPLNPAPPVTGVLTDLGLGGVCVQLPGRGGGLEIGSGVALGMRLPGVAGRLQLRGEVVYLTRHAEGLAGSRTGSVMVGVAFDRHAEAFTSKQGALATFVMQAERRLMAVPTKASV